MADSSRIDELRRRLETDPASIAFAQLAEEYRRDGQFERALEVSRKGLAVHAGYASARVTLGRALLQLGRLDEARAELQQVLESAPAQLAAIRGLAEIHQRHGELTEAIALYETALTLAPNDPEIEQTIADLSTALLKSRNTVDRELAKRQLAAMEQWLLAIHVARVQRHS
jgi:Tfp pilus assembly protein PilF